MAKFCAYLLEDWILGFYESFEAVGIVHNGFRNYFENSVNRAMGCQLLNTLHYQVRTMDNVDAIGS